MNNSTVATIAILVLVAAALFSAIDYGTKGRTDKISLPIASEDNNTSIGKSDWFSENIHPAYIYILGFVIFVGVVAFILSKSNTKSMDDPLELGRRVSESDIKRHIEEYHLEVAILQEEYYEKAAELQKKYGANVDLQKLRTAYQQKVFDLHEKHGRRNRQNTTN